MKELIPLCDLPRRLFTDPQSVAEANYEAPIGNAPKVLDGDPRLDPKSASERVLRYMQERRWTSLLIGALRGRSLRIFSGDGLPLVYGDEVTDFGNAMVLRSEVEGWLGVTAPLAHLSDFPIEAVSAVPGVSKDKTQSTGQVVKRNRAQDLIDEARLVASEYIARHVDQDLHPTLEDVSEYVEKVLRERKFYGPHLRPVASGYIKRNALQGAWWSSNKLKGSVGKVGNVGNT